MQWTEVLKESIEYMEDNILSDLSLDNFSKHIYISQFYFQKAFKIMTGYTTGEYIRNRRLYLAALDLIEKEEKVIDLAYRYGYETPESFSKAFSRFHGLSPMKLKKEPYKIKSFYPIEINVSIRGGNQLDFIFEDMEAFKVMAIGKRFSYESAFDEIPKFWNVWKENCNINNGGLEESDFNIGKYGISIDTKKDDHEFDYYIAGDFNNQELCKDCEILEIPPLRWVKFYCTGPMPTALQALNTRIFNEWLPQNKEYQISIGYNIELYHTGNINDLNYKCEIWIPVKKIK